jgi:glycine hydroxymethyltransferase
LLSAHLEKADPVVFNIIEQVNFTPLARTRLDLILTGHAIQEKKRQKHFINLIPSENFTSQAVLDALGSVMQSTGRNLPNSCFPA